MMKPKRKDYDAATWREYQTWLKNGKRHSETAWAIVIGSWPMDPPYCSVVDDGKSSHPTIKLYYSRNDALACCGDGRVVRVTIMEVR